MDIAAFVEILTSIGVSISSSSLYDFLKSFANKHASPSIENFQSELQNFLEINGSNIKASTVIDLFVENGLLVVTGSNIFAPNQITMASGNQGSFIFGNNSTSLTERTRIEASGNAQIIGKGNAAIVQDEDGSIRFMVGKKED